MKKIAVLTVGGIVLVATIQVLAATHYFQGFETDTYDWSGVNPRCIGDQRCSLGGRRFSCRGSLSRSQAHLRFYPIWRL